MANEPDSHRTQIITALIGTAGVLGAAAISAFVIIYSRDAPVTIQPVEGAEQNGGNEVTAAESSRPAVQQSTLNPRGAPAPASGRSSSHGIRAYLFPSDRSLWPARMEAALLVVENQRLLPMENVRPVLRLNRILDRGEYEGERRALVRGLIASPGLDEISRVQLSESLRQ
jgi:hypothetical protein